MSADNFLGIYYDKHTNLFIGRNCWSECQRIECPICHHSLIFKANSIKEATRFAEESCANDIYEYGYSFLNLVQFKGGKLEEEKMDKFWICWVEGTKIDTPYKHLQLKEAQKEAERLAQLPNVCGKNVYIFECIGKCHKQPVIWEMARLY